MYPNLPDKPTDVVLDLDDLSFVLNNGRVGDLSIAYLFYLKSLYPKFRATLFAIPNRCTPEILGELKKLDWIELAVHGLSHDDNYECKEWTKEEALKSLEIIEGVYKGIFVKGFKAPGWQISVGCYEALLEKGYWVADQDYNNDRRPKELPVYLLSHEWCIHGHTWDILTPQTNQRNGIRQLIEERGLTKILTKETNFWFISEIMAPFAETPEKPAKEPTKEPAEPTGDHVARFGDNRVFLVTGNKRAWVRNPETLKGLGFDFSVVKNYDASKLDEFEEGEPIDLKIYEDNNNPDNKDGLHPEVSEDSVEVQRESTHAGNRSGSVPVWDL